MKKYLCWLVHGEPYIPYKTMVAIMVGSTSSSSIVHGVVDDNSNYYVSMVTDATWINQGDVWECSIINEESNADTIMFFNLLKDSDKPL